MGEVLEVLEMRSQGMVQQATFSPDRRYRYTLSRVWDGGRERCCFILLNPSTADERKDDPTICRCISYARAWKFGGVEVLNLFAWRSTDPKVLAKVTDPVGPMNLYYIELVTTTTPLIVCGWGRNAINGQDRLVVERLQAAGRNLKALKINRDGSPSHPLYLSGTLEPKSYGEII